MEKDSIFQISYQISTKVERTAEDLGLTELRECTHTIVAHSRHRAKEIAQETARSVFGKEAADCMVFLDIS